MKKIKLAGCIIKNSENKILLLHRNTSKRKQWEMPGGKVEQDEKPAEAARREIKEELGLIVRIKKETGRKEFIEDGFSMSYIWYKAVIIKGKPILMEEEFDKFKYFSWNELKEIKSSLSPNTQNLIDAYFNGDLKL